MPKLSVCLILLVCLYISACATVLDYDSPKTVNLSGTWVLVPDQSQEIILARPKRASKPSVANRIGGDSDRSDRTGGARAQSSRVPRELAAQNRVRPEKPDAMTATKMTIDQSQDSMGVRYANGKYRDVDWGKTEYRGITTKAGWEKDTLQIITKSEKLNYSENYRLDQSGKLLTIVFEVAGDEFRRLYTLSNKPED